MKYEVKLHPVAEQAIRPYPKENIKIFLTEENKQFAGEDALDLVSKMLVCDKEGRISVKDAMNHPYFDPVREIC